jgi:hypothetical protein
MREHRSLFIRPFEVLSTHAEHAHTAGSLCDTHITHWAVLQRHFLRLGLPLAPRFAVTSVVAAAAFARLALAQEASQTVAVAPQFLARDPCLPAQRAQQLSDFFLHI